MVTVLPTEWESCQKQPPPSPSSLFQVFSIDLERGYIRVLCSNFYDCCPRDRLQYCLALIANRIYIYESHTTVASEEVLNGHRSTLRNYAAKLSIEEQAKILFSQFLYRRGLTAYFHSWCLRVLLLISLHLGAECDSPLCETDGLGTMSSTGELNREDILDNHKSSEKQPKDWTGLIDKVHLHKTTLSMLGEMALSSEVQKPKQRGA